MRGTAIALVIANHAVLYGQQFSHDVPEWMRVANDIVTPFRMPVMVFLSGLLVSGSLSRKSAREYLVGKFRFVVWPFLVWTAVSAVWVFVIIELRGENEHRYTPLWFLQYLAIYYVIALVTRRINPLIVAGVAFVVTLAIDPGDEMRFATLLVCFMAGVWFSKYPDRFEKLIRRREVVIAAVVLLVLVVVIAVTWFNLREHLRYQPASLPFVAASIIIWGRLAMAWADHRLAKPLRYVGQMSLVYYVVHGYPLLIGAALGYRLFDNGEATVVCAAAAGLTAGAIASWLYRRSGIARALFEMPGGQPKVATRV